MKKRILAILLCLTMVSSMLPVSAIAEGNITIKETAPVVAAACEHQAWTQWDGTGAVPASGNVVLTDNVQLSNEYLLDGTTLAICLNGHNITAASGKRVFTVKNGAHLTVYDCAGTGKLTGANVTVTGAAVQVEKNSRFDFYGGNITGNRSTKDGCGVWELGNNLLALLRTEQAVDFATERDTRNLAGDDDLVLTGKKHHGQLIRPDALVDLLGLCKVSFQLAVLFEKFGMLQNEPLESLRTLQFRIDVGTHKESRGFGSDILAPHLSQSGSLASLEGLKLAHTHKLMRCLAAKVIALGQSHSDLASPSEVIRFSAQVAHNAAPSFALVYSAKLAGFMP